MSSSKSTLHTTVNKLDNINNHLDNINNQLDNINNMHISQSKPEAVILDNNNQDDNPESSNFIFDKWLEEHKIEDAKEVFIKHNMITLNNLSMQHENFGSFISNCKPGLIQSIVLAIQALDNYKQQQIVNQKKIDEKYEEKKEKQQIIYIAPSSKEHAAMEGIQKQINEMENLKNEFTNTQNKWNVSKRSNNNAVETKYEIYFTELEKIKTEIELYIQKLTSIINNRHNTLNNQIKKHQKTLYDTVDHHKAKQQHDVCIMNDILKNYSMTINKCIKHYKSKIVQCRNILKHYSINNESKEDEYYELPTNTQREKKIIEIGKKEKTHYIATRNEIKIYKDQIDEFLQEDLQLILYKTKSNIDTNSANIHSVYINNEIYKNIARNIRSFMSFNEESTKQISRKKEIEKLRKDGMTVTAEKHSLQNKINELSNISQKQGQKIESLNEEIEQLNETLHDFKGNDYIRSFKLYDSGLWNVS
eukprot:158926_1